MSLVAEIWEFSSTIPTKFKNNVPIAIRMKLIHQQFFPVLAEYCADAVQLVF
jgi:hypothetical protein